MSNQEPHFILIAEDDPDDRFLFKEAIQQCDYEVNCQFVEDGTKLINYLREEGNLKPNLVFVGLRLPDVNAHEIISFMKSDPELDKIPVLVFTGVEREEEIRKVYAESGKAYVIKPPHLQDWVGILNTIFKYWFETVRLPHLK